MPPHPDATQRQLVIITNTQVIHYESADILTQGNDGTMTLRATEGTVVRHYPRQAH